MRRFLPLLKLLGIFLFIGILLQLDIRTIMAFARAADMPLLLLGIVFLMAVLVMKSIRWHLFALAAGAHRSWKVSFGEYMIGVFLSSFTPAKLGDFGKVAYLRSYGIGAKTGALIVIMERLVDVALLLLMGLLGAGILFGTRGSLGAVITIAGGGLIIATGTRFSRHIAAAVRYCISHHALLRVILTTAAGWTLHYLWTICMARSVGITVSIPVLIAAMTGASLLNSLPISPMGLGTRETALLFFLTPYGVEPERIVALSMLMLVELLITSMPGSWFWMRKTPGNMRSSDNPSSTAGTLLP